MRHLQLKLEMSLGIDVVDIEGAIDAPSVSLKHYADLT